METDQITVFFESTTFRNLAVVLFGILVILTLTAFIRRMVPRYVADTNSRYRSRKFVNYISFVLILLLALIVYSSQLSGLTVFLGVAGAGIAFALQEVIASIAGFVIINFSSMFKVGDRVMIAGIRGDVVDIGVLRTTMMQMGDWVNGDLYNGRIVHVANSSVFKDPIHNYSGEFPFLWDEVTIPIRLECDHELTRQAFLDILNEVQGDFAKEAKKYWAVMTERFMIENAQVAPLVTLVFDENWITFTLRFVVDFKRRRITKDQIYSQVLKAARASNGKIVIAASTLEVTTFKGE
ncbi:mechanosensitive ion channel family protein [Lewinella sp. W8]|uniref:mechanosensitive ion channel family protein n=1 Tax=Lewinella sp. W8 TaxID=2528208 RepID=UPI001067788C|nr:mechanosensitive ion channel domain-containing protein [Lewinella sp. W8]MTB51246.1 mechanosensitive ion channel [Lewinella sp. W8]